MIDIRRCLPRPNSLRCNIGGRVLFILIILSIQSKKGISYAFQLKIERRDTSIWLELLGEIRGVGRVELEALLDGEKVLLKVWVEKGKTASLLEERLPELKEKLNVLGLRLSTPLIWQRKVSLSPLSFLISPWEGTIDLKG